MGKICLKCGNELSDNAKFCSKCRGKSLHVKRRVSFARIVGTE